MKYFIGQSQDLITLKWLKRFLNDHIKCLFVIVACQLLLGCQTASQLSWAQDTGGDHIISLNGEWAFLPSNSTSANYYLPEADFSKFTNIHVPGNWFTQGHQHHGTAWYKTEFDIDGAISSDSLYKLTFAGVDYFADVWLNGHYLGFHEGYFQSFYFEISAFLKTGNNTLVVKVNSPLEDAGQSWSLHKKYIKGVLGHHDTRPGGAWSERGQEKNTGGIWQSVWIEKSSKISIDQVKFTPDVDENKLTRAKLNIKIRANQPLDALLLFQLTADGEVVEQYQQAITLDTGQQSTLVDLPQKSRRLWSPWEHGLANLYQLSVRVIEDGQVLDQQALTVAFRKFEVSEPDGQWLINGKPLFVRGTNYIAWQWLSQFSAQDFAKDLQLMKNANINAVRVHAHVLPQAFYDEANKLGMLVWQDFPLQWGYVDNEEFFVNAEQQAQEMVDQFYNHPSIVIWSAHNEPPWDADWMKYKYKDYDKKQNLILDERVYQILLSADTSRYAHKSSLTAEHPWLGWYSGSWFDYAKQTNQRWVTEFGAQALPDKSTLEKIVGKKNLWPENKQQWDIWDYHNFQQEQTFNIAKIAKGNNIDEFIRNTQQYQVKLTALAAESYRRQKNKPVNAIFQFMFVEGWPSINWGVVDYNRKTKPGYQALKVAYQPLLPSIEYDAKAGYTCCRANFSLWLINDYPVAFENYQLKYQVFKEGKLFHQQTLPKNIASSSNEKITDLVLDDLTPGRYQLRWLVLDELSSVVSENNHHWQINKVSATQVVKVGTNE